MVTALKPAHMTQPHEALLAINNMIARDDRKNVQSSGIGGRGTALKPEENWAILAFFSNQKIKNAVSTVAPAEKNRVIPSPEQQQKMMMEKYCTILSDILSDDFGYEPSDLYEDGIGGLVVDYMKPDSRICVALCEGKLQFIYEKECEFTNKIFKNLNKSQQKIIDFVRTEFVEY